MEKFVPLNSYLKKINGDPFFFLSRKTRLIEVSLDNPHEDKIPARTDYRFLFSF